MHSVAGRPEADPDQMDGFPLTTIREIKLIQELRHKNITRLRDVVTDPQSLWFSIIRSLISLCFSEKRT
jgi:serine/threonine protein kinase